MNFPDKKSPIRINLCDQPLPSQDVLPPPDSSDETLTTDFHTTSNRQKLTLHLNTIPDAVIITEPAGTIIDLNMPASLMIKQSMDNALRQNIMSYLPGLSPSIFKRIMQSLRNGCPIILEGMAKTTSGEEIPTDISVSLCGKKSQELCFILRDIQHHRRTEEALNRMHGRMAKAERLEAAGTVSGQIAHDFNNLLTPMLAYPSLIRRELADASPALEYLQVLEKTAEDMAHMTQQLLALSRRGNVGNETFNINDVVQRVFALLRNDSMPDTIELESNLADDLLPVRGGSDQMLRVVHNLCQNAIDAVEDGGKLSVKSENIYLESPVGHYESVEPGEYVRLSISDTGPGIAKEIRDKVFEPFFTTKRGNKRRGSGLGLSIVNGIINDHHGYVDLESTKGDGTTFYLYLPVCREVEDNTSVEQDIQGNGEKILILDDDPEQLRIIIDLCKALNYDATGVTIGTDALSEFQRKKQAYDLVILDMRLEQQAMDGCDIWLAIAKMNPDMRSLLVSGFGFPVPRITKAQRHGAGPYVKKPLTMTKLGQAIRQVQQPKPDKAVAADTAVETVVSSPVPDSLLISEAAPVARGRILLVEDEERIRNVFAMVINEELPDVELEQAGDGLECLKKFRQRPYDVVVMDLYMPIMDGRQAFIELREYCREKHVTMPTVIFCTGFAVPKFLKEIINNKDEPHVLLLKPVRNADLIRTIQFRLPHP